VLFFLFKSANMLHLNMQRHTTTQLHREKINDALYKIHLDIANPLHVKDVAAFVSTSMYHFNRLFYAHMGEHVHGYIKRVRLENAANALLFNPQMSVLEIAHASGFGSGASFTHAFKDYFGATPTKWREVDKESEGCSRPITPLLNAPKIVRLPSRKVAYVRHRGYDRSIQNPWLKLLEWAKEEGISPDAPMLGLHHSNPRFVPLAKCHYVACLEIKKTHFAKGEVGIMRMPSVLCAMFSFKGRYGEFLSQMDSVYYEWLPTSGFEKLPLPSFAIYHKNHFTSPDETYVLDFCIPVKHA